MDEVRDLPRDENHERALRLARELIGDEVGGELSWWSSWATRWRLTVELDYLDTASGERVVGPITIRLDRDEQGESSHEWVLDKDDVWTLVAVRAQLGGL